MIIGYVRVSFTPDMGQKLYKFDKKIIAIKGFDDYYKRFDYND